MAIWPIHFLYFGSNILSELVKTKEQIVQNVETLHSFGLGDAIERKFHDSRIKNGKIFVALKRGNMVMFAPSKFAGYVENDLEHEANLKGRDGRDTNKKLNELLNPWIQEGSTGYSDLDAEFLAYCDEHQITPSAHHKSREYWLITEDVTSEPSYYWTKVWGQPGDPSEEALLFNAKSYRDRAKTLLKLGDVVVYLTSDATYADPAIKGKVAGAVEVSGELVMAEDLGIIARGLPEQFRDDGSFRWPYGLTISRSWRVLDRESNDNLIKDHAVKGLQGASFIHEMDPEEIARFQSLRVQEQGSENIPEEVFRVSLRRPWHQKVGTRSGAEVNPGTDLYVAWICDRPEMTVKIGSGKYEDRIAALNMYRRPSQGEHLWALAKGMLYSFPTVENAREAEDYMLLRAKEEGYGSPDHSEFLKDISLERLAQLFGEAVSGVEK